MYHLLYLHGLHSSPQSVKAQAVKAFITEHDLPCQLYAPQLDYNPDVNRDVLNRLVTQTLLPLGRESVGIIGSSMGGFYAENLARLFSVPAVLINPVVDYLSLLPKIYGEHTHPVTGQVYRFSEAEGEKLKHWVTASHPGFERFFVCLGLDDSVVPPGPALARFARCPQVKDPYGGHNFEQFEDFLPQMFQFLFGFDT